MKFPDAYRRQDGAQRILFWSQIVLILAFIFYRAYVGIQTPGSIISHDVIPVPQPDRATATVQLIRGPFNVYHNVPGDPYFAAHPKAVIVFGTGDGGWGGWEDYVCRALQADGCDMITFDCLQYSETDYDQPTLEADMDTIAHMFPHSAPTPPTSSRKP